MNDDYIFQGEELATNFSIITDDFATTQQDTKSYENDASQKLFPILPLRGMVMFPHVKVPISAARRSAIKLLETALQERRTIGLLTQKNADVERPTGKDLYHEGVLGKVSRVLKMPNGNVAAIIEGEGRFKVKKFVEESPLILAEITHKKDIAPKTEEALTEYKAVTDNIRQTANNISLMETQASPTVDINLNNIKNPDILLSYVCINADLPIHVKQEILQIPNLLSRAYEAYMMLSKNLAHLELRQKIMMKTNRELDKNQKEYFLNQQMKTIQDELGGGPQSDVEELREKASKIKWSEAVQANFEREIIRLQRHNPSSPDYHVQKNYLDFYTDLPWEKYTKDQFDIPKAEKILDKAHYGLDDVKKRILEHIAVLKLKSDMKSPILCLVGPPGVGKTSLGKSIAQALGRKYIRVSLGGLHDEAEIRGHRKTYIGAMAGRILQSIKKAGVSNPVVVLDEIDKMGQGINGDPSSAMLEVLDPEQNSNFYDNYLEEGYDLSKVLFVATANSLSTIQSPLLDRMEIIRVSGYTTEEKTEIAKRHLVKKQIHENGLPTAGIKLGTEELKHIIETYTAESGVRGLEKEIATLARWVALQIATEKAYTSKLSKTKINEILGVAHPKNHSEITDAPGVVTGLAWTSVGGDILFIESILSNGKGTLSMTGNLGDVMKESTTIALEYIKAKYADFGIEKEIIEKKNIHVHIPEGATPKDGPSAGIALLTSMVSSYLNKKVKAHLAMTGEITLRGKVLPVGGIKEKLLAAKRAGITEVILCKDNRRDVEEIKKEYLEGLKIHYVERMSEVISIALEA